VVVAPSPGPSRPREVQSGFAIPGRGSEGARPDREGWFLAQIAQRERHDILTQRNDQPHRGIAHDLAWVGKNQRVRFPRQYLRKVGISIGKLAHQADIQQVLWQLLPSKEEAGEDEIPRFGRTVVLAVKHQLASLRTLWRLSEVVAGWLAAPV